MDRKSIKKTFKIADIWLASALSLTLKIEPELTMEDGKVIFCFPFTAETLKALDSLNSGLVKYDYITFSEAFKSLRHKMFTIKNQAKKADTRST